MVKVSNGGTQSDGGTLTLAEGLIIRTKLSPAYKIPKLFWHNFALKIKIIHLLFSIPDSVLPLLV